MWTVGRNLLFRECKSDLEDIITSSNNGGKNTLNTNVCVDGGNYKINASLSLSLFHYPEIRACSGKQ